MSNHDIYINQLAPIADALYKRSPSRWNDSLEIALAKVPKDLIGDSFLCWVCSRAISLFLEA